MVADDIYSINSGHSFAIIGAYGTAIINDIIIIIIIVIIIIMVLLFLCAEYIQCTCV